MVEELVLNSRGTKSPCFTITEVWLCKSWLAEARWCGCWGSPLNPVIASCETPLGLFFTTSGVGYHKLSSLAESKILLCTHFILGFILLYDSYQCSYSSQAHSWMLISLFALRFQSSQWSTWRYTHQEEVNSGENRDLLKYAPNSTLSRNCLCPS